MPPHDSPWEWVVRWEGQKRWLAGGTVPARRCAMREIEMAMKDILAALPCYCILSDGDNTELRTEYCRVIEVFIPG